MFMTSTLTLTKEPDSMLLAMFSGRHALRQDDDGTYFIDRDATHFCYILNYLRDGGFRSGTLPADPCFLAELCTEAEYYQLSGLTGLLADQIRALDEVVDDSDSAARSAGSGRSSTTGPSSSKMVGASPSGKRLQRKVSAQQMPK